MIYHPLYSMNNFVTNKSKLPQDGAHVFPYMGDWLSCHKGSGSHRSPLTLCTYDNNHKVALICTTFICTSIYAPVIWSHHRFEIIQLFSLLYYAWTHSLWYIVLGWPSLVSDQKELSALWQCIPLIRGKMIYPVITWSTAGYVYCLTTWT